MLILNVRRNYTKEYRRAWQYIIISVVLILVSTIASYYTRGKGIGMNFGMTSVIIFYSARFIQRAMTLAIPISFITLLKNLYKRFATVNNCLRYRYNFVLKILN